MNVEEDVEGIDDSGDVIANDPNLVGEWHLDEGFGQYANDTSGNGNNGTLMPSYPGNAPNWTAPGVLGNALEFDGLDDFVSVPDDASLNITDEITIAAWMKPSGESSGFKKPITISNPGALLTNYQINITVDFVPGKMNADFSDLRFYDSNGTKLTSWVESQISGTIANVWVEVPSIPSGDSIIFMRYGDPAATHEITWSGSITLPTTSIPSGWVYNTDLDGRFPRGNNVFGGTAGTATHDHTYSGVTDMASQINTYYLDIITWGNFSSAFHTHSYSGTADSSGHLPPYLDVIYSSINLIPFDLDASCIAVFDTASLPTGWSQFAALDNSFPRGSPIYGFTGGSPSHSHTFNGFTDQGVGTFSDFYFPSAAWVPMDVHVHVYSGTTTNDNSLPPYLAPLSGRDICPTYRSRETTIRYDSDVRFDAADGLVFLFTA
jgi:hypothetical protein